MTRKNLLMGTALAITLSTMPAFAQGPAPGAPTTGARAAAPRAAVPATKVASRVPVGAADPAAAAPAPATAQAPAIALAPKMPPAAEVALSGAGSTFAKPLYEKWAQVFTAKYPTVKIGYQGIGSVAGIGWFQSGNVNFAGSDFAMSEDQVGAVRGSQDDLLHVPTAFGGIVVTYRIPGLTSTLRLTGEQLAQIYLGKIRFWNDPELKKNNPELEKLPRDVPIIVFHRADGSGTTYGFTSFLDSVSSDWHEHNGVGFASIWLVGDGKGSNAELVEAVNNNPYSIGYADYNFVIAKKLPMASLRNARGNFVQPSLATIQEAVSNVVATSGNSLDLRLNLINARGDSSYPVVTATYVILHQHQSDRNKAEALSSFLSWGLREGQTFEPELNYVPLPDSLVVKASKLVRSVDSPGAP